MEGFLLQNSGAAKPVLVYGITYHGTTAESLGGLDNAYGKHINAPALKRQLHWLAQHFKILTIDEIRRRTQEGTLTSQTAFLAFHDGYQGNYLTAFPLLKELHLKASFFISTAFIGSRQRFWVDLLDAALKYSPKKALEISLGAGEEKLPLESETDRMRAALRLRRRLKALPHQALAQELSEISARLGWSNPEDIPLLGPHEACMDWDQVREMSQAGMEFGSHTHRHIILARQDEETMHTEMQISKLMIERETGKACTQFCYPNGTYPFSGNDISDRVARELGFSCVVYMEKPYNLMHAGTFRLTGVAFGDTTTLKEMRNTLSRTKYRLWRLRRRRLWSWDSDSLTKITPPEIQPAEVQSS